MPKKPNIENDGPWEVRDSEFPESGSDEEKLRFLLNYAILAPSTHNTQPWLWEIRENEVALFADRSRLLPALDPMGRELIMSCGAALQHLRLAIRAFGYADIVALAPDAARPDLLAYVRLAGRRPPTAQDRALFEAIRDRHTNRRVFDCLEVPPDVIEALQDAVSGENVWLQPIRRGEATRAIIDLVVRGDLIQASDPNMQTDIFNWITARSAGRDDGIPGQALGMNELSSQFPAARRAVNGGVARASKDEILADSAPVIAVLGTENEGPAAWLAAGQGLARVLLCARQHNLWVSFFNQPAQVDQLWPQLRHVLGRYDFPQLILRIGYAAPVPATPRRPVSEVLTTAK